MRPSNVSQIKKFKKKLNVEVVLLLRFQQLDTFVGFFARLLPFPVSTNLGYFQTCVCYASDKFYH